MMSHTKLLAKLSRVIEYGDVDQFNSLVGTGCNVHTPLGSDGWPPICCAVARRKQPIIAELLKQGADPNHPIERGMAQGMVALDFCQDVRIAEMLLKAGARLDIYDSHGRSPLDWAACMDRTDVFDLLTLEPTSNSASA